MNLTRTIQSKQYVKKILFCHLSFVIYSQQEARRKAQSRKVLLRVKKVLLGVRKVLLGVRKVLLGFWKMVIRFYYVSGSCY